MGRELKRVALDFNWPLHKTWKGFLNPHWNDRNVKDCPFCDHGSTPEAAALSDKWYGKIEFHPEERGSTPYLPTDPIIIECATRNCTRCSDKNCSPDNPEANALAIRLEAKRLCDHFNGSWMHHLNQDDVNALVKANRLYDLTHKWEQGKGGWTKKKPFRIPTAKEVNDWSLKGFGHDSINNYVVVRAECKRLGIVSTCPHCKGEGKIWLTKEIKKKYDTWKEEEPPQGKGYQIWETVSEGSPVSPVFEKPADLANWMVQNDTSITRDTGFDGWMKFILGDGWAPSMIGVENANGNYLMSGVAALGINEKST